MKKSGLICGVTYFLLLVGGLNLGFMGIFDFNILNGIFGDLPTLLRTIYVLIGVSALWCIFGHYKK